MTNPNAVARRHEFVLYFDVANGNPNGDPEAGSMPRMDPETGHGLVSDVSLKRKIRNFVEMTRADRVRHRIYVTEGSILNEKHREAYFRERPDDQDVKTARRLTPKTDQEALRIRQFMCDNFFDIRAFGGVLSTGINAGQVRGPVQLAFGARSSRFCRWRCRSPEWRRPMKERKRNVARAVTTRSAATTEPWAASTSCLTGFIAHSGLSRRH